GTDARGDPIGVAANGRIDGLDEAQGDGQRLEARAVAVGGNDPSMVAQHKVAAVAGNDGIDADAADDDVGRLPGGDRVATAAAGIGRLDQVDVGRVGVGTRNSAVPFLADPVDPAEVAEDNIGAIQPGDRPAQDLAGIDQNRVVGRTAEHDVGADTGRDGVGVAANARIDGLDKTQGDRLRFEARAIAV